MYSKSCLAFCLFPLVACDCFFFALLRVWEGRASETSCLFSLTRDRRKISTNHTPFHLPFYAPFQQLLPEHRRELKKYEEKYPHPSQPTTSLFPDKSNQADSPHLLLPLSNSFESLLALEKDFKTVMVGDSHARHLAPLISERTSHRTRVNGVCRPGDGLLTISSTSIPPPDPRGCLVLLVGTNDVTAGRQTDIFQHFEEIIKQHEQTSRILVTPLPHRHDLPPSSQIHDAVSLVNHYLEELCVRYKGAELDDIRHLRRKHFTQHGLHLRTSGKILFADAIVRGLAGMSLPRRPPAPAAPRVRTPPRGPEPAADCESPPTQDSPRTLPHETFADAVKTNTAASPTRQTNSLQTNDINTFLGNPLLTMTQN
ncbi:hypothetical protein J6590_100151 [Homalodisca vitripennis]|nr:hypothetical protein J6590_100151 [Homalodisca vitripennis]